MSGNEDMGSWSVFIDGGASAVVPLHLVCEEGSAGRNYNLPNRAPVPRNTHVPAEIEVSDTEWEDINGYHGGFYNDESQVDVEPVRQAMAEYFGTDIPETAYGMQQMLASQNGNLGTAVQHLMDSVPAEHDAALAQVLPSRAYDLELGVQYDSRIIGLLDDSPISGLEIQVNCLLPTEASNQEELPYDTTTGVDYL